VGGCSTEVRGAETVDEDDDGMVGPGQRSTAHRQGCEAIREDTGKAA
jgi:hypothetical protein